MYKRQQQLRSVNLGCATHNVLTMELGLPDARYATPALRLAFFEQLLLSLIHIFSRRYCVGGSTVSAVWIRSATWARWPSCSLSSPRLRCCPFVVLSNSTLQEFCISSNQFVFASMSA